MKLEIKISVRDTKLNGHSYKKYKSKEKTKRKGTK